MTDTRWKQRFNNYTRTLQNLTQAIQLHEERGLSELETRGSIQSFEILYELSWNLIRDYWRLLGLILVVILRLFFAVLLKQTSLMTGKYGNI